MTSPSCSAGQTRTPPRCLGQRLLKGTVTLRAAAASAAARRRVMSTPPAAPLGSQARRVFGMLPSCMPWRGAHPLPSCPHPTPHRHPPKPTLPPISLRPHHPNTLAHTHTPHTHHTPTPPPHTHTTPFPGGVWRTSGGAGAQHGQRGPPATGPARLQRSGADGAAGGGARSHSYVAGAGC